MPLHLRSGEIKQAPVKKYTSGHAIFMDDFYKLHPGQTMIASNTAASKEWDKLDDQKRQAYDLKYETYLSSYKQDLLKFYGHTNKDIKTFKNAENIPDRPVRPINGLKRYEHSVREMVEHENPDEKFPSIRQIIGEMYDNLTAKERSVFENQYDKEFEVYSKKLNEWTQKYGDKMNEHNEFVKEKFRRSKDDHDFHYQELPYRNPQKMTEKMGKKDKMDKMDKMHKMDKMDKMDKKGKQMQNDEKHDEKNDTHQQGKNSAKNIEKTTKQHDDRQEEKKLVGRPPNAR